jgi:hypothetical protein
MRISLDFNAKIWVEYVIKSTIENDTFHETSTDKVATVVTFATPKYLAIKSKISLSLKFHK